MSTTPATSPRFTMGSIVTKKEKSSLILFWVVTDILTADGVHYYNLGPHKHAYNPLGWEAESNLIGAEVYKPSEPKFKLGDVVSYRKNNGAVYTVKRIIADGDVFRYALQDPHNGSTWADQEDLTLVKEVVMFRTGSMKPSDPTAAIQIGTLTHQNRELQTVLDAARGMYDELQSAYDELHLKYDGLQRDYDGLQREHGVQQRACTELQTELSARQLNDNTLTTRLAEILGVTAVDDAIVAQVVGLRDTSMSWRAAQVKTESALTNLRKQLGWALDCTADDKDIFTKLDYIKNLAYNPAKFRIGDEVEDKSNAVITTVKGVVPQTDGTYRYKVQAYDGGVVKVSAEKDLKRIYRAG